MTTPTEKRLAEIEAREKAATQGPWGYSEWSLSEGKEDADEIDFKGPCIWMGGPEYGGGGKRADLEFLCHARSDIPWLVAEVRRLRDVILFEKERANEFGDYELACRMYRALRGEGDE